MRVFLILFVIPSVALKYALSPRRSLPPSRCAIAPLRRDGGRRSLGCLTSGRSEESLPGLLMWRRSLRQAQGRLFALLRMTVCCITYVVMYSALQIPVFAADNSDSLETPRPASPPFAMEILAQVRANFPREALFIKGQILSGGRLGKLEQTGYVEMFLDLGGDPAIVRYKISDAFGTPFEQMTISMTEGGEAEFEYETGNPPRPAAAPPPTGVIRDTDVTWNDLSLLFLWRTDARTVREESLRGRDCYVLEFPPHDGGTKLIWIDMQMLVFIQMEQFDGNGRLQRRMIVKNIKKISDQWMIKNLEIRSYPSLHHTLIRIDAISP